MLRSVADALHDYCEQKSAGASGRRHHLEIADRCRQAVASILGVSESEIAFMASATACVNAVCAVANIQAGANVVVNDLEFPSMVLPFLRLRQAGVEVRIVRNRNWVVDTKDVIDAVDANTRLVAVSHVSYVNSLKHDLGQLRNALDDSGAWLIVDATQSLGVLGVAAENADFLVCSSYKWLLGIHGLGILYWNRARVQDVEPTAIGPSSVMSPYGAHRFEAYELKEGARRFELGYPAFPPLYALATSIPLLTQVGIEVIERHVLHLGQVLVNQLDAMGLEVLSPRDSRLRGSSVAFAHPSAELIGRHLAEKNIHVWSGDGRVRASIHLFNDSDDIRRFIDAVTGVLEQVA